MAVLRKEQKETARLGAIGIVREAFELLSSHLKFFMWVQILLMLPLTILAVTLFENKMYSHGSTTVRESRTSNFEDIFQRHSRRLLGEDESSGPPPDLYMVAGEVLGGVLGFGVCLLLFFLYEASTSLSSSAILYAVGQHYTGQSVSFQDALRASWKGSWMRLTITNMCRDLLLFLLWIVVILISLLGLRLKDHVVLMVFLFLTLLVFFLAARVCLDIIFMLAAGVSVLEKHQRWAVLSRSRKLLEGRVPEAVLFKLLWWVPTIIVASFKLGTQYQTTTGSSSPGNMTASVLFSVVYIGLRVFLWQMKALSCGVLYVSCKAYHKEDLAETISTGGFELVASEKDTFLQSV